jgi:1A family penicillin-binding protein
MLELPYMKRFSKPRRFLRRHWRAILLWSFGALLFLGGIFFLWAATLQIPDLSSIETRQVTQSLKIYDRTGTVLLYDLNNDADRTVVPLSSISPNVQNATIAIEDPNFYTNPGIEVTAILRALFVDLTSGGLSQGGSTLTQQVVKNTILTNDKTITRKLKEWVLSLKLERVLSKQQILELYLNQAPYGGSIYGVEQASETFFGIHASDLSVAQSAYLAAMLPAPSFYSPYGNNKAALDERKNIVLDKMFEHGYLTAAQRDEAKSEAVSFLPPKPAAIVAPHFVFYVQQYLEQKYGADAVATGGWTVITTLDADLQAKAEAVVQAHAATNQTSFNASNTGMIALDPTNGQILVMVGSRNYFDTTIGGNFNVTLAGRQPGSTFKPFAYAEAWEKGYTPDTVLFDVPTQFSTSCKPDDFSNTPPCYSPVNYDGLFRGPMTMRDAIAQSINVPSVKTLYLAGIADTLQLAKSMGITTLGDANQYGLTLVLGGGEVTLLQMSSAYGAFATNGTHYPTTPILQIKDANGNIIEDDTQQQGTQVMPATIAEEMNDVLSDPVARAPLGENDNLSFPGRDVAVKTGTTNNYRDAWTIGYTPNLVVGVWAGNNDNTPMVKKVSGFIVGPEWHDFMVYALAKTPAQYFTRATVDESNLKPVLRGVWQGDQTQIVNGREIVTQSVHEILNWVDTSDPNGSIPTNPQSDPQYLLWDLPVRNWAAAHGLTDGVQVDVGAAPTPTAVFSTSTPQNNIPIQGQ